MTGFKLALFAVASLAAVAEFTSPAAAVEYPWCLQYTGKGGGSRNCGFSNIDQCRASASGTGFCEPNTFYNGVPERPARRARRAKNHNG